MYDIRPLELNVGDRVGVCPSGWYPVPEIRTVTRKTATQVILDDGSRWNKYGTQLGEGSSYHRSHLMTVEEAEKQRAEEVARRKHLALVQQVEAIKFKNVNDDGLHQILQVAKDHSF